MDNELMDWDFAIKLNNACVHTPCTLCGETWQPPIGPIAVYQDDPVCDSCAFEYAPQLLLMVKRADIREMPAVVARDFLLEAKLTDEECKRIVNENWKGGDC